MLFNFFFSFISFYLFVIQLILYPNFNNNIFKFHKISSASLYKICISKKIVPMISHVIKSLSQFNFRIVAYFTLVAKTFNLSLQAIIKSPTSLYIQSSCCLTGFQGYFYPGNSFTIRSKKWKRKKKIKTKELRKNR